MEIAIEMENFANHLKRLGHSPYTIESYGRDCRQFLEWCGKAGIHLGDISPDTISQFSDAHQQLHSNSLRRKILGIRKFFRYLHESGNIAFSPVDLAFVPRRLPSHKKKITSSKFEELCEKSKLIEDPVKAARDLSLVLLLGREGLKVSELITLTWPDYLSMDDLSTLKVRGSRQERIIRLNPATAGTLRNYRKLWRKLRVEQKWKSSDKVFISYRGKGLSNPYPGISRHGVKHTLYELGSFAGFSSLNSEALRHHAIEAMLDEGWDPEDLKNHLGLLRLGLIDEHLQSRSREISHDAFRS